MEIDELLRQIQEQIVEVESVIKELKRRKEILHESMEENEEYRTIKSELAVATSKKKIFIYKFMQTPENESLDQAIHDNCNKISDLKQMLSAGLLQYHKETDRYTFKDANGRIRQLDIRVSNKVTNQPSLFEQEEEGGEDEVSES